jgi:hypothetical protein
MNMYKLDFDTFEEVKTTKTTSFEVDPDVLEGILRHLGFKGKYSYDQWFSVSVKFVEEFEVKTDE